MCLFFGNIEECNHAECQIVSTIRALNQNTILAQNISSSVIKGQNQISLSQLVEDSSVSLAIKEEQREEARGDEGNWEVNMPDKVNEEWYRFRIEQL